MSKPETIQTGKQTKPKSKPRKSAKKDGRGGKRAGSGRPKGSGKKLNLEVPIPESDEEREKLKAAIGRVEKDEGTTIWDELARLAIAPGRPAVKIRALNICQQALIGTVKITASKAELKSEHHEHQHIHAPVILPELYPHDEPREAIADQQPDDFVEVPRKDN